MVILLISEKVRLTFEICRRNLQLKEISFRCDHLVWYAANNPGLVFISRDHFVNAPSQCETTLQCNVVSHCLCAFTKWPLHISIYLIATSPLQMCIVGQVIFSDFLTDALKTRSKTIYITWWFDMWTIDMWFNKIWWLCLVSTSTTRFASDVGCRMAKNE